MNQAICTYPFESIPFGRFSHWQHEQMSCEKCDGMFHNVAIIHLEITLSRNGVTFLNCVANNKEIPKAKEKKYEEEERERPLQVDLLINYDEQVELHESHISSANGHTDANDM